jgi:acetoacetate decarboxylase
MPQGFSIPFSATGRSSLAPRPPWHFVGDFLAIEFWADPAAVAALLPPGVGPGEDPGKCALFFSDNQYVSEGGTEIAEPSVNQYMECLVAISASWEGKPAAACPFLFVDNDNSMVRGHIQGMPKQLGTVRMTRSFSLPSQAAPLDGRGGFYAATLAHRDRRLVTAGVTLTHTTEHAPNRMLGRLINVRHMASLQAGRHERPAVHELVRQSARDVARSQVWTGTATLDFGESPSHELAMLQPLRTGAGYRYTFAMTVDDLLPLRDLSLGAAHG